MDIDLAQRAARPRPERPAGLPQGHLADPARGPGHDPEVGPLRDVPQGVRRGLQGRRALELAAGAEGRPVRVGRLLDLRQEPALLRRDDRSSRRRSPRSGGPASWRSWATASPPTTSRRPGSIKVQSPAGRYLIEHGVDVDDFNSYGSRRGNHEVMVRGTFANVRLRNKLAPGTEGGVTRHLPDGEVMTIFEASERYRARGGPADHPGGQGVRLGLVARLGGQGAEAPGHPRRHRRELRAHPPLEPGRHGHPAAPVRRRRQRREPRALPARRSSRSRASPRGSPTSSPTAAR